MKKEFLAAVVGKAAADKVIAIGAQVYSADREELAAIIGTEAADKLISAFNLGRELAAEAAVQKAELNNGQVAAGYFTPLLRHKRTEECWGLLVDNRLHLLKAVKISKGTPNGTIVPPRDVFRAAIMERATAVIIGHNHPGGDAEPSTEDRILTKKLVKAGKILQIPMLDHVIIGDGCYYSFQEHGEI